MSTASYDPALDDEEFFAYEGPPELRKPVLEALSQVIDPELAMNIVDLGLVYFISIHDKEVRAHVTMTSAACPVADIIVEDTRHALIDTIPDAKVDVELVWEPEWSPDRISTRARRIMGG
ncbi:MAG: metal-sulfur cluster assembly factor [Rubrivivax sp.]|jgi:metal-sulfur cluster biosynthetic enzyme|nr:metal-sulfur cluster assembly factor [Rubrivivax sp.]